MNKLIIFFLFSIVSCANLIDQVHRQIDREEKVSQNRQVKSNDRFASYRERNRFRVDNDKRPIKDPVTYNLGNGAGGMRPPVKRDYRPQRYRAEDFQDNDNTGSLWANQGQSSSLFTYQNDKHTGDMVIINVLENLRNQISAELKRTFPDKPSRLKDGTTAKASPASGAPPAAAVDNEMDMKIYDKISGFVAEEVSKDYIVLRGTKEVIYKKEKRSIEVQALVSRKDIMENDYVNSDKLLESRVYVVRDN
jgi:flagellar L-ring protein FlgH